MLNTLITQYQVAREEQTKVKAQLRSEIDALETKIVIRQKQIDRLENRKKKTWHEYNQITCSWINMIIKPLMQQLENKTGLKGELIGPYGLNSRTLLCLIKHSDIDHTNPPILSLTIRPPKDGHIQYETGETTNQYQEGSIADVNGCNEILADLPNTVDEIIKILQGDKTLLSEMENAYETI